MRTILVGRMSLISCVTMRRLKNLKEFGRSVLKSGKAPAASTTFVQDTKGMPQRLEHGYLVIALTLGASFVFIIPPFQVADEPNHFYRAYQISCGKIFAERRDESWGGEIPRSLVTTVEETSDGVAFHPEKKVSLNSVIEMIYFHPRKQRTQFVSFPNTASYSPVPYIPQVVAIEAGKLFGLSPLLLLYLGRLLNILTAVLLCWQAIKIAPILVNALFLIVLAPMFVYQAASLSADALTNSLSIFLTAMVLSLSPSSEPKLTAGDLARLGTVLIALGLCKNVYCFLSLAYFIIPRHKVGGRMKYYAIGVSLFLLSAGVSVLWMLSIKASFVPYLPGPSGLNDTSHFIWAHPVAFAQMMIVNLFRYALPYAGEAIGLRLGWLDTKLPAAFIATYAVSILLATLTSRRPGWRFSGSQRMILSGIAVLETLAVIASMFPQTEPGSNSIRESQGRYFIPLLGIYACTLHGGKFGTRVSSFFVNRFSEILAASSLLLTLYFIVKRFYIS